MKKFLKIAGIFAVSVFGVCYAAFLFIVPNAVNLDNYKSDLQKIVKDSSGISLEYGDAKLVTTPLLSAGVKTGNINALFPDGSSLFSADKAEIHVSLPALLFKTVKITDLKLENPSVNIDIVDGNSYKIEKLFEQNEKTSEQKQDAEETKDVSMPEFKFSVPKAVIKDYVVKMTDLKTGHNVALTGKELKASYTGKNAALKTSAQLLVDERTNVTADLDLKTQIPETFDFYQSEDIESETSQEFFNPVLMLVKYDMKGVLNSKLNIKHNDDGFKIYGHADAEKISLKFGSVRLPESFVKTKFNGEKIGLDSNLYFSENEKAAVKAELNPGKSLYLKLLTDKIKVADIVKISGAAADSLHFNTHLSKMSAGGVVFADAEINTDFKNLKSKGTVSVNNASLICPVDDLRITGANALLDFSDNKLNISNTSAFVNGTKTSLSGSIDKKSMVDIKLVTEKMPLKGLYATFAPNDVKKSYNLQNGAVSLNVLLKGKMSELKPDIDLSLYNLKVKDKSSGMTVSDETALVNLKTDFKTYNGKIKNKNLKVSVNGLNVSNPAAEADFDSKNIKIVPSDFIVNGATKLTLSGDIKNYASKPSVNVALAGNLRAADLKKTVNNPYFYGNGVIPVRALLTGSADELFVTVQTSSDNSDYFTPVDIKSAVGKQSIMQLYAVLKDDVLTIKDTGLYTKNFPTSFSANPKTNIAGAKQILFVNGEIKDVSKKYPKISNLKVELDGVRELGICAFRNSKLFVKGHLTASGYLSKPEIKGNFDITNLSIPALHTSINKAVVAINNPAADFDVTGLNLNGSSFNVSGNAVLNSTVKVSNLKVVSQSVNADKVLKVTEDFSKLGNAPSSSSVAVHISSSSSSSGNVPVIISSGNLNIKYLSSGNIVLKNIVSKISMNKNIFYLNDFSADAFNGKLSGDISTNIVSGLIKAKVKGTGLDADKTVVDCANMKNTLYGTLNFVSDISFKGSTYQEQMNSLKGAVNLMIKDGQFGSFGRFETFLRADNLLTHTFLSSSIGALINSVAPYNTAQFSVLNGQMTFANGYADISKLSSSGKNMSLYIVGKYNLINNNADMNIAGRVSPGVTSVLGPLFKLNPVTMIKSEKIASIISTLYKGFFRQISARESANIPALTPAADNTALFTVVLRGDLTYPQKAVKSFKWLNTASEIKSAQSAATTTSDVKSVLQETVKVIPTNKQELQNTLKDMGKNTLKNFGKSLINAPEQGAVNEPIDE